MPFTCGNGVQTCGKASEKHFAGLMEETGSVCIVPDKTGFSLCYNICT